MRIRQQQTTQRIVIALMVALCSVSILAAARPAAAVNDWLDAKWHFRVPVSVAANGLARNGAVAEVSVNFGSMIQGLGYSHPLNTKSLRVVEVDNSRNVIDDQVPFQFDEQSSGVGTLSILLVGQTPAAATRHYDVYFDIGDGFSAPTFTRRISLTRNVKDEGFDSYRLDGANTTLFYHTTGGGFSSLLDANGIDWISWSTAKGDAGDYRGIPNLVHPANGGYFHPGRATATSSIAAEGPLKVTIISSSKDGTWRTRWDVFPTFARMTVLAKPALAKYWFQYEGTPGGVLTESDRVVRADGRELTGIGALARDISSPEEWMYIADDASGADGRSLFITHHKDDNIVDSYRPLGKMTILAFGRDLFNGRFFADINEQFTFGLVDSANAATVTNAIRQAMTPFVVSIGQAQLNGTPTPPTSPLSFAAAHDGFVDSAYPTRSYGAATALRVRDAASDMNSYLKFNVTGVAAAPQKATLRLYVTDAGPNGGALYQVANDYLGTATPWLESGLQWRNAPAVGVTPLAAAKPATRNQWLEFDVTSAVTGNGTYSFALSGGTTDVVVYASGESTHPPQLVILPAN